MKILVPTDFSPCANNALHAACKIGQKFGAEIHIYNSAELPEEWEDLPVEIKVKDSVNRALALRIKASLLLEVEKIKAYNLKSKMHYTGGNFLGNIEEIISENNFNLIVMGSKGTRGKHEWFIGSNAQKVIRNVHLNTLIVKDAIMDTNFSKVVFATNLSTKDKSSFVKFLEFIRPFEVEEVHILAVDTFGFFSQPSILMLEALKDFKAMVKGFICHTHFISDYSVDSGIRNFTSKNSIELIGISNNTRNPIKRIFQGSNVEMLVNHSDVPVLCLDD